MKTSDFKTLFEYNAWANACLLKALLQLTSEEFVHPLGENVGSIRDILVHQFSAEWGWLERCGGRERGAKLNSTDYPTLESVQDLANRVNSYGQEFLTNLQDETIGMPITFTLPGLGSHTMTCGEILQHIVVHGGHHRGQAGLILRLLGHTHEDFDILFFYRAQKE